MKFWNNKPPKPTLAIPTARFEPLPRPTPEVEQRRVNLPMAISILHKANGHETWNTTQFDALLDAALALINQAKVKT